ncbi:cytochrome c3 family protein [Acetobacter estunensis]|uniref:cytochrome c3 family protein n=1 Tax=Acetobacter estunensis TaxID=104097 RepID=UPI0035712BAB
MPLSFAHVDHGAFNCVTCHHDHREPRLALNSSSHTCLACHKHTQSLAPLMEAQFHELCEGCHLTFREQHRPSGPVRACHVCHMKEEPARF